MRSYLSILSAFIFLLTVPSFAQTENIDFTYELVWKEDTLNLGRTRKDDFILQVRKGESCFQSIKLYNYDRVLADFKKSLEVTKAISSKEVKETNPVFNYRIFKTSASLNADERIMRKWYAYKMDFDTGEWEIHAEQDSVAGYWSQKATIDYNGRSYVAWFTNTIPVSDGPYVFYGLPGLIVQLYDSQHHYTFTLKGVEKGDSEWPEAIKSITSSTFEEISKMKRMVREDPLVDPLISGFFSDPQAIERLRKRAKFNNNPLEKNQ